MRKVIFQIILLGIICAVIAFTVDIPKLLQSIAAYPPHLLLLATSLLILLTYLKIWRFFILLKMSEIHLSFAAVSRVFFASQALTPLPGGEASRIMLIKKESSTVEAKELAPPVFMQAHMELYSAAVVALLFSFIFDEFETPALIIFSLLTVILIIVSNTTVLHKVTAILTKLPFLHKAVPYLQDIHTDLEALVIKHQAKGIHKIRDGYLVSFGIALLGVICGGVIVETVGLGFDTTLNLFIAIFAYAAAVSIQGLATITPGGIGFTESGMAGILVAFGTPWSTAFPLVIIYRFITFILPIIIGLAVLGVWYANPLRKKAQYA